MITGRGLGFSGGTLDKLESVPGFTVSCDMDWIERCITTVGCCIAGQTEDIVPADRVIYACRGITATVECIPLIVGKTTFSIIFWQSIKTAAFYIGAPVAE